MAWTAGQKLEFVQLLRDNKEVLFGEFSPSITKESKNRKWEEIADQMRAYGAVFKDIRNLRINRWDNIKQKTRDIFQQSGKTGAGGQYLSEIDNVVLDILGRDSAYLNGVGKKAGPPNFGGQISLPSVSNSRSANGLDDTMESNLENVDPGSALEFSFAIPSQRPPRTSSPTNSVFSSAPTRDHPQNSEISFRDPTLREGPSSNQAAKRAKPTNILCEESYKEAKQKKVEQDLAEGQLRMELMRAQLETEKRKAAFYNRARQAIEDGSCFLEIRSPTQGNMNIRM